MVLLAGALLILALALAPRADAYMYWTNGGTPGTDPDTKIGRANNDGTNVNQSFIRNAGPGPCLIAANDTHLFRSNQGLSFDGTTLEGQEEEALVLNCRVTCE